MTRTDRITALLDGDLTPEEALELGVTDHDCDDVIALLRLDLESLQAANQVSMKEIIGLWLRTQPDDPQ